MRLPIFLCLALAVPGMSAAGCPPGMNTFLGCTLESGARSLDVCFDDKLLTYAFGPTGKPPELALSVPMAAADYTPWPGVGRSKWEAVRFVNGGYGYEVNGTIGITYPEDEDEDLITVVGGEIRVFKAESGDAVDFDGAPLATLACDPGTVDFPWSAALSEAKRANGFCWSHQTFAWEACD